MGKGIGLCQRGRRQSGGQEHHRHKDMRGLHTVEASWHSRCGERRGAKNVDFMGYSCPCCRWKSSTLFGVGIALLPNAGWPLNGREPSTKILSPGLE